MTEKRPPGRPPIYDEPTSKLNVDVPASIKEAIQEAAKAEGVSATRLLVRLITGWLKRRAE